MKRRWLTVAAALLLIVLMLGAMILTASASGQYYQLAVNDKVMVSTSENMPLTIDGKLYVPYIMLDVDVSGVDLGVRVQYSVNRGRLVITNGPKTVTFDMRNNTAQTDRGAPVDARAVTRGSMVFLPVEWLCSYYLDLRCAVLQTNYGVLVRLTNRNAVLSDDQFVKSADRLIIIVATN